MIKKISIKNVFGIKNFKVDFQISHYRNNDEHISDDNGNYYAKTPTFLAKNAAGKTSFVKAVEFAMRFINKESFSREISHYKMADYFEYQKVKMQQRSHDGIDSDDLYKDGSSKTIQILFNQIAFSGAEMAEIKIEFIGGHSLSLELTDKYFYVIMDEEKISVDSLIQSIDISDNVNQSPGIMNSFILNKINETLKRTNFISDDISHDCLFKENLQKSTIADINTKYNINRLSQNIIKEYDFDAFVILLKKIDSNISYLTYSPEEKAVRVHNKDFDDMPISLDSLSFGTQKVIEIISRSIKLFKNGGVMLIDEIENGLHLSLIKLIVSMYEDEEINKGNAQIIFTTHNPLIAERKIVNIDNIFMKEGDGFINLSGLNKVGLKKRTETKMSFIRQKNYYNDLFWLKNESNPKSTLSQLAIDQITNKFIDGRANKQ